MKNKDIEMDKIQLSTLVKKVEEVPVFPQTVIKIMTLLKDKNSSALDIEKEIMKDQGLTTKVLKVANSSFYSGSRQIKSVGEATVLLGHSAVKSLVLASTVGKVLEQELKGYEYERNSLWRLSQISAFTARAVAKNIRFYDVDEAYTAGLLKDVGKVILDEYVHDSYTEIKSLVENDMYSLYEAEDKILGFNNCDVGARIIEKWNLDKDLVEAIRCHNDPFKAKINPELAAILHVSEYLVMMMGIHEGIDTMNHQYFSDVSKLIGLDETALEDIVEQVQEIILDENIFM